MYIYIYIYIYIYTHITQHLERCKLYYRKGHKLARKEAEALIQLENATMHRSEIQKTVQRFKGKTGEDRVRMHVFSALHYVHARKIYYVCVYIYIYARVDTSEIQKTFPRFIGNTGSDRECIHIFTCIYIYTCIHIPYARVCGHAERKTCDATNKTCMCVYVYIYIYIFIYLFVYVCMCNTHIYMYIYMHTYSICESMWPC